MSTKSDAVKISLGIIALFGFLVVFALFYQNFFL
ncbi:hypothetical protein JOC62_001590 [Clostridium sardiniense]|nr:hypothetical protein [Clostridium sardiniense]MDQ0461161.1 hypothetical protein [Clostridium sardiniense]